MHLFTRFMEENGVPWQAVAERVGLPPHIPSQDAYLPTIPVLHLLQEIVIRQDFPEMSARVSLDDDGEIKLPLQVTQLEAEFLSAPSLYASLQAICSGSAKYWSRFRFWLRETDRNVWLCSRLPLSCSERGHEQQVQSRVIRTVGLIERYLGCRWRPDALLLETALPSPLFAEVMDCPRVVVNAHCSALAIPKHLMARSGPLYRPGEDVAAWLAGGGDSDNWTWLRSLQVLLPEYVFENQLSLAQIAEVAHVSPRSLQRELANQGTSFRELVDGARFHVAKRKLTDTDLRIEEIGQMLGYTQPSHFSRAFRRFAGRTPSQYRAVLQAQS